MAEPPDRLPTRSRPLGDSTFAAWILAAYLPVAIFSIAHHEMWRDEVHCWLVARDSATPWDVIRNRAYDGHPPLWYLLLWVLEKVTHDPRSMQVVHVGIAAACVWVFARFSPFSRLARALFPFGYFLAYEYVALSRCYGLALLLGLLLAKGHRRAFERPWVTAGILAALALTTTVSTLVAAAYGAVLAIEWLGLLRRGDARARRGWIPLASAALSVAAAAACAWPPADSTVAHLHGPGDLPDDLALSRVIAGLLPVPKPDFFFWNSNLFLSFEPFARLVPVISVALVAWLLFGLSRERTAAIFFGAGVLLLLCLFAGVYGGDVRHHGFFFVLFVMAAWIASAAPPSSVPARSRRWAVVRRAALGPTLAAILVVHLPGAAIALAFDAKYIFSSGGRAAALLRARGLADALLVAELDYPATAVIGQLGPRAVAYSPRTGRPFSFVRWTRDRRREPTDSETLAFAASLGAARGVDAVLLMNRPLLPALVDGASVVRIAELYDSMIEEENFYIYRVRSGAGSASP